ncbi:hypothetical protein TNCV_2562601 [Trichonephila clavipes]|uniref:Uncharacterized protein n=1 Tax=Trichonephila clavipes TaxID=2585209 RepID=A0A8X6UNU1_TRICX|nr:hypothetical protein TNCV_2562601 [Trichonephila clavipes]
MGVSRTLDSSCDQTHVTCFHLHRSCGVQHLSEVTITIRSAKHDQYVDKFFEYEFTTCYLREKIASDNFQQDLFSRNLPFSAMYRKTARRNLPGCKEFHGNLLFRPVRRFLVVNL